MPSFAMTPYDECSTKERKESMVSSASSKRAPPAFEEVLDCIGSRGKFQRRFNIVFNCIGPCINLLSVNIFYLAMQTPDHWCHVPGREYTNLSLEEWKNFTIPREGDTFSKCLMYNGSNVGDFNRTAVTKCQHGWDYDDTWFSLTAPSQMNWVCDRQHIVSNILFYAQNIGVVLALLFGYIGDMYGRRPQQFLCIAAHVVSRLLIVLTPQVLVLFILAEALVPGAAGPMYESALSVGVELTDIRHRTTLNNYASCFQGSGMIATAFVAWTLRSWTYYTPFVALCHVVLFCFIRWFPESPRWLACRGQEQGAMKQLRRIALTNGKEVPPFAPQVMLSASKAITERKGFLSIFSSWNVFKNTAVLAIARSVYLLTHFSLVMAVGGVGLNPFLTLALQGATHLPAYWVVHFCAERFGRRWTAATAALLSAITCAVGFCLLTANLSGVVVTATIALIDFFTTGAMAMANLQSIEVHPTCLRQIAACVEWAVAGVVMSTMPYLALMSDRRMPCAILAALNFVAAFLISFLPESALQRLPETLHDAAVFGKGQSYWSWKPKPPPEYAEE